jgi:hypothetical protein
LIVPIAGGQPREVLRLPPSEALFNPAAWTPDSGALIIQKNTGSRWELWRIPLAGAAPRKLDIDASLWRDGGPSWGDIVQQGDTGFSLSPDGHNVALTVGKNTSELWVLENFLPKVSAGK